jgi:hypothetical protein
MRKLACSLLTLACLSLLQLSPRAQQAAQQKQAADKLILARGTYYTPTANGLDSFHCAASMDWKDYITRIAGKDLQANSAFLAYVDTVHLSVSDDLKGSGSLQWTAATAPPQAIQPNVQQVRDGLEKMFSGFFQTWNPYMNGTMVPSPDPSTTITPVGDGMNLHAQSGGMAVDESVDKNLLLTQIHVSGSAMDVVAFPTYLDTPDGRVVASVRSTIRQPPTAPPVVITMAATYTRVQSFQLPAKLTFEVQNVGTFVLNLSACTVKASSKSAIKP